MLLGSKLFFIYFKKIDSLKSSIFQSFQNFQLFKTFKIFNFQNLLRFILRNIIFSKFCFFKLDFVCLCLVLFFMFFCKYIFFKKKMYT